MSEETRDVLEKAELMMQKGWLAGYERVTPELVEEIRRLRKALRPFADHGRALAGCDPTDQWCEAEGPDGFVHWLAVQHFHEAHAALRKEDSDDQ